MRARRYRVTENGMAVMARMATPSPTYARCGGGEAGRIATAVLVRLRGCHRPYPAAGKGGIGQHHHTLVWGWIWGPFPAGFGLLLQSTADRLKARPT